MTPEEQLAKRLEALGLHVEPGLDTTAEGEYIVYEFGRNGVLFGDDAPCLEARHWLLIYAAPIGYNRMDIRTKIQQIVEELFETWPSEESVADKNGQRWLYEFDTIGGIGNGSDGSGWSGNSDCRT